MLALIARAAADPAVDVEKMRALLDMQERLLANDARAEYNDAYGRLQLVLPRIKKHGVVEYPVDKAKPDGAKAKAFSYARWEDIDAAIRPLLNEYGFSLSYDTQPVTGGGIIVTGKLLHSGGHFEKASIGPLPLDTSGGKNNLQGAGSTFSYGCRYTARMLLNLIYEGDDDDGVRGGMVFITDAQVTRLNELIEETGADRAKFLEYLQVVGLGNIQAKDYVAAENALMKKKRGASAKVS
jgi:hypothetical protein